MSKELNPWKILSAQKIYDNPWIHVTEFDIINPGGGKGIYGKVHFKNLAVGIVAMDAENQIYLVGQYRFTIDQYSWEIPEGGSKHSDNPLEGAKRELLEETGLDASNWQELMQMHLSNSVSDELAIIYLATGLQQKEAEPEETEQLVIKKIPFEAAYREVIAGRITDSITVAAILKVKLLFTEGILKTNH